MKSFDFDLAVIGLGYVGLPLAIEASRAGLTVLGLDIDSDVVSALGDGRSHIEDVTDADVATALSGGFQPTTDPVHLAHAAAIVISVPTPLTEQMPDLTMVTRAAQTVGDRLQAGQLVVLESTSYPGTTEEVVRPLLEAASGLTAGNDFFIAFSPERIDPGNPTWTLKNTPKVVGGIDAQSTARAAALYGKICDEVVTTLGTREAEMSKLLENTYRQINIALVNEMAVFCRELGIDVWDVIRAASSKPFGFAPFYPGPGVGGHCIPIDPNYLSYRVRMLGRPFRFVELAQEINNAMPQYVVDRVQEALNQKQAALNGSKVLLLGVGYKPGLGDTRGSPTYDVARLLLEQGAEVSYCDPHVDRFEVDGVAMERHEDPIVAAAAADIAVILTAHAEFQFDQIVAGARAVLDTRGVTRPGTAAGL